MKGIGSAGITPWALKTCAMMGQAAGVAAAFAAAQDIDVHAINPVDVRRIVEERGAELDVG